MGGLPTKQAYYDGIHEIDDDEALILETPLPTDCRYWQALVADDRFSTVDWVNRQSSLNDAQAHIDTDGWFRGRRLEAGSRACPTGSTRPTTRGASSRCASTAADDYPDRRSRRCRSPRCASTCPPTRRCVTPDERRGAAAAPPEGAQLRRIW